MTKTAKIRIIVIAVAVWLWVAIQFCVYFTLWAISALFGMLAGWVEKKCEKCVDYYDRLVREIDE